MAMKTFGQVLSDLLLYMLNPTFCLEDGLFKNNTGGAITAAGFGQLVKWDGTNFLPVMATNEAQAQGIIVSNTTFSALANNGTQKVTVLRRGPAIVHKKALPTNDVAGAAITAAARLTALAALNIIAKVEPSQITEV